MVGSRMLEKDRAVRTVTGRTTCSGKRKSLVGMFRRGHGCFGATR